MEFNKIAAKYVLGLLSPDALTAIGLEALDAGLDSPSLRQLAGSQGYDREKIENLFSRTMEEINVSMPSPPDAGLLLAKMIAEEILQGTISPYEGAKRIWGKVYVKFPQLTQLRSFVGLASEYEDDDKHREYYSERIIENCKILLKLSS